MSCTLTLLGILASQFWVIPVESIHAKQANPIAPRGGVIMVQLLAKQQGDGWPATLDVLLEDNRVVTGVLGWVEKNTNTAMWTNNPSHIRPIERSDDTRKINPLDANSGPVLLVSLPLDADGIIRFGGDAIKPQWVDLPASLPHVDVLSPIPETGVLSTHERDDAPEWNPLEYWRWTLVASRMGVLPPEPPNDSTVARLAALQGAQLWRIGFDRLARSSRGVAAECRDVLTNIAHDGSHSFACWVVRPEPLHQLLSTLLDESANSRQLVRRVLRWIEDQQLSIMWLDQVFGEQVSISIANPTLEDTLATLQWLKTDDIPIAIEVPATQTSRIQVERMPTLDLSIFGPVTSDSQIEWLAVSIDQRTTSLPIVPRTVVAMPPSVLLQTLHPLWTLASVQSGRPDLASPQNSTTVQVRKLLGKWEIFVQCRGVFEGSLPPEIDEPSDLRGFEAITILHPSTNAMLSISPQGQHKGIAIPNDLEVHTSVNDQFWAARIVLPEAWVTSDLLSFSIVRSHGNSQQMETGPLPCVPWAITPASIRIDLSAWDEIQRFPTHLQIR